MSVDDLTYFRILNKHSINVNYFCCVKQFVTQQIFHTANDGKVYFLNLLIEHMKIKNTKLQKKLFPTWVLRYEVQNVYYYKIINIFTKAQHFTQRKRAPECACNHCHLLMYAAAAWLSPCSCLPWKVIFSCKEQFWTWCD